VIDLRARNWVPKTQVAAPSTLAQVHEAAAKEASEKASTSKPIPILKSSSRRGQNRTDTNSQRDGDNWMHATSQLARSASKISGVSMGSTLGSMGDMSKSPTAVKFPSSSNMAHSLARLSSEPGTSRMSRIPSEPGKSRSRRGGEANRQVNRRTSADFVQLDAATDSGSTGRKRLQLLPRSVAAAPSPTQETIQDIPPLAATVEEPPSTTAAQAKAKIDEDVKEFMQIRDLNEATGYFESLPSSYRHLLVDRFAAKVDAKEAEIILIAELFSRISSSGICTAGVFERGFAPTVEALDDISLDVPSAYDMMARFLRASRLSREAVGRLADLISIYGSPIVHPRDKLLREFDGAT
jgi:translation initiation factor 4G